MKSCFRIAMVVVMDSSLGSLELRFPLLHARRDSFARVVTLEEKLLQLALDREPLAEAGLEARLHGPLDAADGLARLVRRRELTRVLVRGLGERPAAERRSVPHVVDETDRLRLVERHQAAGDHQLERARLADDSRQPLRAAG